MNYEEYISFASEVRELESLLAEIPKDHLINRMGLESRLKKAKAAIQGITPESLPRNPLSPETCNE